jgi:ArsR family transcriptional regulator
MNLSSYQDLFAVLGEKLRLRIACCLLFWRSGLSVCELVDALQRTQPTISRHLRLMKSAGLVQEERDGRWIYYRLIDPADDQMKDLHSCLENVCGCNEIQDDLSRLKSRIRLREKGKCVIGVQKAGVFAD